MKAERSNSTDKLSLELKYCERCGGLWLRPVGGEQIYCVACGRAMAELPPPSYESEDSRLRRGRRWGGEDGDVDGYEGEEATNADGVA